MTKKSSLKLCSITLMVSFLLGGGLPLNAQESEQKIDLNTFKQQVIDEYNRIQNENGSTGFTRREPSEVSYKDLMSDNSGRSYVSWIVGRIGKKVITSQDVLKFYERVMLKDQQKQRLFRESQGDYSAYKQAVSDFAYSENGKRFQNAAKQLIYLEYFQHKALLQQGLSRSMNSSQNRSFGRKAMDFIGNTLGGNSQGSSSRPSRRSQQEGQRIVFNVTEKEFSEKVQKMLDQKLESLEKDELNYREKMQFLGQLLQDNHYPHKEGESILETFQNWYKGEKAKIYRALQSQEVKKWMSYQVQTKYPKIRVGYLDMQDTYKELKEYTENKLSERFMTKEKAQNLLEQKPKLQSLISNLEIFSLQTDSFKRIGELSNENKEYFLDQMLETFQTSMGGEFSERALGYIQKSRDLSMQHSQNKLQEKSDQHRFKPDNSNIMLRKLYRLAAYQSGEQNKISQRELHSQILRSLDDFQQVMTQRIQKEHSDLLSSNKRESYPLHISQALEEHLKNDAQLESLVGKNIQKSVADTIGFYFKVRLKNGLSQTETYVNAEICEYSERECYKSVESALFKEKYDKRLNRYYTEQLRPDLSSLSISLHPDYKLRGERTYEFLIE